jgi:hypothetical protein
VRWISQPQDSGKADQDAGAGDSLLKESKCWDSENFTGGLRLVHMIENGRVVAILLSICGGNCLIPSTIMFTAEAPHCRVYSISK